MKYIMVIDDEENIRRLYRDELQEWGYRVTTVSSGREAMDLLKKDRPDLITLDIRMEGGPNGIETLRNIKEYDSTIPVIMLTAYSEFKQDFGVWASEAYLVKSSNLESLKTRIEEILRLR